MPVNHHLRTGHWWYSGHPWWMWGRTRRPCPYVRRLSSLPMALITSTGLPHDSAMAVSSSISCVSVSKLGFLIYIYKCFVGPSIINIIDNFVMCRDEDWFYDYMHIFLSIMMFLLSRGWCRSSRIGLWAFGPFLEINWPRFLPWCQFCIIWIIGKEHNRSGDWYK